MYQKITALLLAGCFCVTSFAQVPGPKASSEADAKLENDAVEFLRDTSLEVDRLRLPENRISFNSELASLMWFHDEKAGREMYNSVIADFKQLMGQLDSELNSPIEDEDQSSIGGIFGGYGRSTKAERKLIVASGVRQSIAMSLAEHAPDLAYGFFYDTQALISNPKLRERMVSSDKWFEKQLLTQIAKSDPAKAVEYGKASLKSGVDSSHISLLRKLYAKDPDKAADLADAILSKLKSDKAKNAWVASELLSLGDEVLESSKKANKKPLYTQSDLRELAELYVQILTDQGMDSSGEAMGNITLIEKYAPSRAAQLRSRRNSAAAGNTVRSMRLDRITAIGNAATNTVSSTGSGTAYTSANVSTGRSDYEAQQKEIEAQNKAEIELYKGLAAFGAKQGGKEERGKFIAAARASIAKLRGKDKKVFSLSLLAAQVAKAGDAQLASEIMRDAERLVDPQPRNYQDFLLSWTLASGYAQTDPEKAFPILENTISRANGTIAAAAKIAEFIDVNDDYITDGEAQVGVFGGTMVRGITAEIGGVNLTLRALAKTDFAKTAALANAFDRPEIRVLARMMVLRALLEKDKPVEEVDIDVDKLD